MTITIVVRTSLLLVHYLLLFATVNSSSAQTQCSRKNPCPDNACCSKYGYCGYTKDHCGPGCLSNCTNIKDQTINQQCSKTVLCPDDACCSKWNFCGTTDEHCGSGCLSGPCTNKQQQQPMTASKKTAIMKGGEKLQEPTVFGECSKNRPCPDGSCCSKFNYCGRTPQHCGPGCQSNCNAVEDEIPTAAADEEQPEECSLSKPCSDGSCCSKQNLCGYGPEFCAPENCLLNCEESYPVVHATTECGRHASPGHEYCPLNICCSQFGYCGTTPEFCRSGCQSNCEKPMVPTCPNAKTSPLQRIIGYYASWSLDPTSRKCGIIEPEKINPETYTHIIVSFATIENGKLAISESDRSLIQRLVLLKRRNPKLKIMLAVGGWAFNDKPTHKVFSQTTANARNRGVFVKSVVDLLDSLQLDGLDVDWEYPVAEERGGEREDKDNYVLLLKEMRRRFGQRLVLSVAAPASYWYLRHFDVLQIAEIVDWINVMSYDMHGVWDSPRVPFVFSHTNLSDIHSALEIYYRAGVRPEKLNLGLAFYARTFRLSSAACALPGCQFDGAAEAGPCTHNPGTLSYHEIVGLLAEDPKLKPRLDKASASKILIWGENQWMGYDDPETLQMKLNYVRTQCIGGVMVWSIDQDDSNKMTLEKTLHQFARKVPITPLLPNPARPSMLSRMTSSSLSQNRANF